jgi:protein arginine kinase activator
MKCEFCKKAEASVQVKQVTSGVVKDVFLCVACAEKSGLKAPDAVADFLFGLGSVSDGAVKAAEDIRRCTGCGLSLREFRKHNRVGCEACYEMFAPELKVMIDEMQRASAHCGKVPSRELSRDVLSDLKAELLAAVQQQAFERAAELRDKIRELEQS